MSGSGDLQIPPIAPRVLLYAAVGVVGLGLGLAGGALVGASHATTPDLAPRTPAVVGAPADPSLPAAAGSEPAAVLPEPPPGLVITEGVIEPGGSLASALVGRGVSPAAVDTIARELRGVFDFRRARPGDAYRLVHDAEVGVVDFRYSTGDLASYHLWRAGERYVAERREPELVRTTARIAGVVAGSLYGTIKSLGESPQLASDFAELFAWDVDFSRTVQEGDEFAVLYERLFWRGDDGEQTYMGPGLILAARYRGQTGEHGAVYFETLEHRGGYYRPDGSSVERQFLLAPLKYSRVSSRFSRGRRHPILKVTRPHPGIDYAAPTGTPLFSVADGRVIFRGRAGGFGKLVKIRHANGYVSYYGHMSRFASGLSVGDPVRQKQVIGYVGRSGLATGPHVCFRIARDGRFVNPASLKTPAGDPVPSERMPEFELVRDALFAQLDGSRLVATDEAL